MSWLKVLVPPKVLLLARSVEEAAAIVWEAPREMLTPLTVMDEFCRALLGRLSEEDAAPVSTPEAEVYTKRLLPRPMLVVVERALERVRSPESAPPPWSG